MTRRRALIGAIGFGLVPPVIRANEALNFEDYGKLARIIDGDSFVLTSGLKVRLSNIFAPQKDEPLAEAAKATLSALLSGRQIGLFYVGDKRDRYDRALAQVYTLRPDGQPDQWIQNEMVRAGYARVRSYADSLWQVEALLNQEQEAREAGRGLWQSPYFAIRTPDPNILAQDVDSFQLVEGLIISTADVRGQTFLNYGSDYRTDFTISIARRDRKKFEAAEIDLLSLEGARVRVRGWVELYNGPSMWVDHSEAIEFTSRSLI